MKLKLSVAVVLGFALVLSTACQSNHLTLHAPPGQVKKATGSKSAKPFAPGQQKKKNK